MLSCLNVAYGRVFERYITTKNTWYIDCRGFKRHELKYFVHRSTEAPVTWRDAFSGSLYSWELLYQEYMYLIKINMDRKLKFIKLGNIPLFSWMFWYIHKSVYPTESCDEMSLQNHRLIADTASTLTFRWVHLRILKWILLKRILWKDSRKVLQISYREYRKLQDICIIVDLRICFKRKVLRYTDRVSWASN